MAPSRSRMPKIFCLGEVEGVLFLPFTVSSHLILLEWVPFGGGDSENFLDVHAIVIVALLRGGGGA